MRDRNLIIILVFYLLAILASIAFILKIDPYTENKGENKREKKEVRVDTVYYTPSDMELVLFALIWQESKGDTTAIYKEARGVLQITPIYIREVNNRFKSDFTPSDAFSFQKSVLIWKMFQDAHNPLKHPKKAILLHNPKARDRYFNEVWDKYRMLKYYTENIEKVKL